MFVGITEGRIVPARGPTTFGWDPIFEPEGFHEVPGLVCLLCNVFFAAGLLWATRVTLPSCVCLQTYAEMDKAVKNTISHRRKSLDLVREFLVKHYGKN